MRFLSLVLLSLAAAYALGFYIAVPANPEIQFWKSVVDLRTKEIASVRQNQAKQPIIFFTGGSSCAFSIDPKIIEETCGLPAFNLGLPVTAGDKYLVHQALQQTRPGDILVICLEPDLLTATQPITSPSKFSFAIASTGGKIADAAGGDTFASKLTLPAYLNLSRPGPTHITTLAAKLITKRGYRYTAEDIRYRGRIETQIQDLKMAPSTLAPNTKLSVRGRQLLELTKIAAQQKGVGLVYSMPWHYTSEEYIPQNRSNKRQILNDIDTIIPSIDDSYTGAVSVQEYFSDTGLHLSKAGSELRSQALATELKRWLDRNDP